MYFMNLIRHLPKFFCHIVLEDMNKFKFEDLKAAKEFYRNDLKIQMKLLCGEYNK